MKSILNSAWKKKKLRKIFVGALVKYASCVWCVCVNVCVPILQNSLEILEEWLLKKFLFYLFFYVWHYVLSLSAGQSFFKLFIIILLLNFFFFNKEKNEIVQRNMKKTQSILITWLFWHHEKILWYHILNTVLQITILLFWLFQSISKKFL